MNPPELDPTGIMRERTENALRDTIAATVALLESVEESVWSQRLRTLSHESVDAAAVLGLFGGMGSLNDLWIAPKHGQAVDRAHVFTANERLDALRDTIYRLANELQEC